MEEFRAWQTPGGDDSSYTCADMKEMTASATQEHKNEVKLSAGLGGPLTRPNTAFWSPDRRTAVAHRRVTQHSTNYPHEAAAMDKQCAIPAAQQLFTAVGKQLT